MEFPSANPDTLDFAKSPDGLLPAVIQDAVTQKVLMLGYMNAEALQQTISTGKVTFFSRSKQRLWVKGETSGNFLWVEEAVLADCDNDALLIKVRPEGPVCHTGADTCWNEKNQTNYFLPRLESIIHQRIKDRPEESYTARLLARGLNKVAQKVGEEAVETVIEALGNNRDLLLQESADLIYHLLVLLAAKEVNLSEVEDVLRRRNG